ncbi:ABC transporter permease [Sporanaerobacter acetigenes]|uniref:ABC transporter permease n=1 Tax=Sporanaerobacter acetigenes TaxID=165813 RepID=UPI0033341927
MCRLISCEFNKLIKNNKNKLVILLLIFYLAGFAVFYYYSDRNYISEKELEMRDQRYEAKNRILAINMMIKTREKYAAKDEFKYEFNPLELELLGIEEKTSLQLENYYKEYNPEKWRQLLQIQIKKFENLLVLENNDFLPEEVLLARGQSPMELKKQIILNEYLLDKDIEPIESPYKLTGINFLVKLLEGSSPMIIIILTVLLCIDIFTGEIEEGSYKLYLTQPFTRGKIFASKIISILLFAIGTIFGLILITFLILSILNGVGSGSYPQTLAVKDVLFSMTSNADKLGDVTIVSSIYYIALGYIILLILIIATVIISTSISIKTNSISITLGTITGILMITFVLSSFIGEESLINLIYPFSYLNIYSVLNAQINSSFLLGLLINITIGIILIMTSFQSFKKEDFLGGIG